MRFKNAIGEVDDLLCLLMAERVKENRRPYMVSPSQDYLSQQTGFAPITIQRVVTELGKTGRWKIWRYKRLNGTYSRRNFHPVSEACWKKIRDKAEILRVSDEVSSP